MIKYVMVVLVLGAGCGGVDDRCSLLIEERYRTCAGAEVQIEIEQCSEECVEALEQSTCENFKEQVEVCHESVR